MRIGLLFTSGLSAHLQAPFLPKLASGRMKWFTPPRTGNGSACRSKVVTTSGQRGDHAHKLQAEQARCSEPRDNVAVAIQASLARGRSPGAFGVICVPS